MNEIRNFNLKLLHIKYNSAITLHLLQTKDIKKDDFKRHSALYLIKILLRLISHVLSHVFRHVTVDGKTLIASCANDTCFCILHQTEKMAVSDELLYYLFLFELV